MKETESESGKVVTLTVFHFESGGRIWPFIAMAFAGRRLSKARGLRFRKMMGAGQGIGFSVRPDFGRYALLGTWDDISAADDFLDDSRFMNLYRTRANRITTWFLSPRRAHGEWEGRNPFVGSDPEPEDDARRDVAVLTRATIRLPSVRRFWRMVSPVSQELESAPGLLWSIGVGEVPWLRQATFSVWESESKMKEFAYGAPVHREVIRRTRDEAWYSEDLFARFSVLRLDEWSADDKG